MLLLIYVLIFVSVCVIAYHLLFLSLSKANLDRIQYALPTRPDEESVWFSKILLFFMFILEKLSPLAADKKQVEKFEISPLKMKLVQAGFQGAHAPWIFLGAKVFLALLFLSIGFMSWFFFHQLRLNLLLVLLLLIFFAVGFYLPDFFLARKTKRRQLLIFNSFPDALDLMRMCVQSGLGLDQSLERVGKEMVISCLELSKELDMTGLELRAGVSRANSLRNLSMRIGLTDVDSFVVTLIQSDRFGNSVSDALAIYADALRSKRRIASEEMAAKLPIKLMIPLIFCILPSLLAVLLGPAIVHIHNRLIPILGS